MLINSVVPTNVLELEHAQAQYIYIDDPRYNGNSKKICLLK